MVFRYAKLLWLLKWVRIIKVLKIAEPRFFAKILKKVNENRLELIIDLHKEDGFDPIVDHIQILRQILYNYIYKILRIGAIILVTAYISGILWWIIVEIDFKN